MKTVPPGPGTKYVPIQYSNPKELLWPSNIPLKWKLGVGGSFKLNLLTLP